MRLGRTDSDGSSARRSCAGPSGLGDRSDRGRAGPSHDRARDGEAGALCPRVSPPCTTSDDTGGTGLNPPHPWAGGSKARRFVADLGLRAGVRRFRCRQGRPSSRSKGPPISGPCTTTSSSSPSGSRSCFAVSRGAGWCRSRPAPARPESPSRRWSKRSATAPSEGPDRLDRAERRAVRAGGRDLDLHLASAGPGLPDDGRAAVGDQRGGGGQ